MAEIVFCSDTFTFLLKSGCRAPTVCYKPDSIYYDTKLCVLLTPWKIPQIAFRV